MNLRGGGVMVVVTPPPSSSSRMVIVAFMHLTITINQNSHWIFDNAYVALFFVENHPITRSFSQQGADYLVLVGSR